MLTKLEVRNRRGSLLTLLMEDVSVGLIIQNIDGLDPVNATIVSSSFAQQDGEQEQSSRREKRNIILKLEFDPYSSLSAKDLRNKLYSFFMSNTEVQLRFYMSDGLVVNIVGRVESCVAPLFTKEPMATISIICFDPDFLELDPVTVVSTTTATTTETLVTYSGNIESGFVFAMTLDRDLTEFTIYHTDPTGTIYTLDFSYPLESGDILMISTIGGSKYARVTRAGSVSYVLQGITAQSKWLELDEGDNYIRVYAIGTAISYSITYNTRHGALA